MCLFIYSGLNNQAIRYIIKYKIKLLAHVISLDVYFKITYTIST